MHPVLLIISIVIISIISHCLIVIQTYECPECKNRFRPRWYDISVWIRFGRKRLVKCPHCHRKSFCRPLSGHER